jgi:hypothetical protein
MRNGFLGSVGTLLASAGLAWAQAPAPSATPTPTAPAATATATDKPAPKGPAAPAAHPHGGPGGPGHGIPLVAGPEDMPPTPYEQPYGGELDCERDFDFWVGGEYLRWSPQNVPVPIPLISTGPPASQGRLSNPFSRVLLGGSDIDLGQVSGARITAGWGVVAGGVGFESTTLILEKSRFNFPFASDLMGRPTLARPVIDNNTGQEQASLIASPGQFTGSATVEGTSRLWGTEVNMIKCKIHTKCFCADWLIGFRYLDLDETLVIRQQTTVLEGGIVGFLGDILGPGSVVTIGDSFRTRNEFYGGQLGAQGEIHLGNFFIYALGKVAIGNAHQSTDIQGGSTLIPPGGVVPQTTAGGLLALSSNSIHTSRDSFTFIPEVNVNVGYQFGKHIRVFAGYSFIYWDDVLRPGDQLDRRVNPALIPTSLAFGPPGGVPAPPVLVKHTDYWIQGVNAGAVFRY